VSAYLVIPLVQSLFSLVLAAIVLKGHTRETNHRLFSLYLVGLAIWGFIIFGMRASSDVEHAFAWEQWIIILGPFLSVIFYHFAVHYTATEVKPWLIPLLYFICLLFVPLAPFKLVITGIQIRPFGYAPLLGVAVVPWIIFIYVVPIMTLRVLIRTYKTSRDAEQRNRIAYILAGLIISLVGGCFDIIPALGLPLYPGAIIGYIVFCLITTIAILRHNLLDIYIVIRRGVTYLLTSSLIAIPFVGLFMLLTSFSAEQSLPTWVFYFLLFVLALITPQLWKRVQQRVDKWFYRERYDYLRALETFSWQAQNLEGTAKLGRTMVNLIAGALQTSNVHLLQPLPQRNDFYTVFSASKTNSEANTMLRSHSPIVKWLRRTGTVLSPDDFETIPQLQSTVREEKKLLQRIGTKLIVPLGTRSGQLSGVLLLGEKLSGQPYSVEDMQTISVLTGQMAVSLENARLYSDALEARHHLETWLNSMSDGVMIVNTEYVVQFMNSAAARDFRDSNSKLCWKMLGLDAECPHCPIPRYLNGNRGACRGVTSSGGRYYDLAIAPLTGVDGGLLVIEVLRDVTENKRLQEELDRSSRLASVGMLAAGIAHEINNPLTGVLGFSHRLLRKSTDQKVSEDLRRIYTEAERAAKIVQNLLAFARRRQPKKELSDVNEILQSALELRAYELKTSNIEVITDLAPSLAQIMLDFHQIQEVFLNIILNAEQAMTEAHSGGRLIIRTEERKGYIRTTFIDDGPGIPAEHLDKLFDPFFSTKGERGGTGLGLSVCHGIVTEHGGKIYARSKRGKGATFFIELPLVREEKDASKVVHKRRPTPIRVGRHNKLLPT
jgi:signal transduction histidine kinase